MMRRRSVLLAAAALAASCGTTLQDRSDLILIYTPDLDRDEAFPYAARYLRRDAQLVFVAARHEFDPHSATHRLIRATFERWRPRSVIVEGFPTTEGPSPASAVSDVERGETAWARGEAGLATRLATAAGIPVFGGEPTDRQVFDALIASGYSVGDLTAGLVLLAAGQSFRAGQLTGPTDPNFNRLFDAVLQHIRRQNGLDVPLNYGRADFEAWYLREFGVDFGEDAFALRRTAPDPASRIGLMFARWNTPRDLHLYQTIRERVASDRQVLCVFGGSHFTALRPALTAIFGAPEIVPGPDS